MSNKVAYNLKDIVGLCLDNDVDIEIFHGNSDVSIERKPENKVRAVALITLVGLKVVRVDFGDKKHGQLVSRVHAADNHRDVIKIADLVEEIASYKGALRKRWGVASNRSPAKHLPYNAQYPSGHPDDWTDADFQRVYGAKSLSHNENREAKAKAANTPPEAPKVKSPTPSAK
jgi:hypothetical protein